MMLNKDLILFSLLILVTAVLTTGVTQAENEIPLTGIMPLLLFHEHPHPYGKIKCLEDGGQVITEQIPGGDRLYVCELEQCYTYDIGEFCEIHRCDLERYYDSTCVEPVPPPLPFVPGETVASYFHEKVTDILRNIGNTGYAHNADNNFSLIPDHTGLAAILPDTTPYNLFLDCSGFVGYYVIQGLAEKLYQDATPSNYICQERPLAADFADLISAAPQVGDDHPAATMQNLMDGDVCWGQVKHLEDIKHGDVIVYKHPQHITDKTKTCDSDGRVVHEVSGNTGHILFAHGTSYQSDHCKANLASCSKHANAYPGDWQYVIEVADSTTSPHMNDTRHLNNGDGDQSDYRGNLYHAWSAGADGLVERCDNGSYHRHCILHGTFGVEAIKINTKHPDHATGIGTGKMYISQDRKSYRSSYTSSNVCSKKKLQDCSNNLGEVVNGKKIVFIGRPIYCPQP